MRNSNTRDTDLFTNDNRTCTFVDNNTGNFICRNGKPLDFGNETGCRNTCRFFQNNRFGIAFFGNTLMIAFIGKNIDQVSNADSCRKIRIMQFQNNIGIAVEIAFYFTFNQRTIRNTTGGRNPLCYSFCGTLCCKTGNDHITLCNSIGFAICTKKRCHNQRTTL